MAMSTIAVGQVVPASLMNDQFINTKFAIKPSDTSRASTASVSNDPDLQLSMDQSKSYLLEGVALLGANSTEFRMQVSVPGGTVIYGGAHGFATVGNGGAYQSVAFDASSGGIPATSTTSLWGTSIFDLPVIISAVVVTGGTAGTLVIRWAQTTSSGTPTVLRAGSWILLRRVA